jgi:hypothetical protein
LEGWGFRACEERVEGLAHFATGQGDAIAWGAVVEASVIGEAAKRIVEEEVGGTLRVVCLSDSLGFVVKERERESVFESHLAKFVGGVFGIGGRVVGADRYEPDAPRLVLASDAENLLANMDNIGTMSADEHYKQRSVGRQGRERNRVSGDDIREGKIAGRSSKWDRAE